MDSTVGYTATLKPPRMGSSIVSNDASFSNRVVLETFHKFPHASLRNRMKLSRYTDPELTETLKVATGDTVTVGYCAKTNEALKISATV